VYTCADTCEKAEAAPLLTAISLTSNPLTAVLKVKVTSNAALVGLVALVDRASDGLVALKVLVRASEAVLSFPAASCATPTGTESITSPSAAGLTLMVYSLLSAVVRPESVAFDTVISCAVKP